MSSLSSCSIRLRWVPGHSFLPGNDAAMRSTTSALCNPLSLLLAIVSTFVFSRNGGVLSHRNLTHRFPRFPTRDLCSLVTLAVFSLVFAATDTAYCLSSCLSRIGRIENPSCSACGHLSRIPLSYTALSSYGLFAPLSACSLATVSLQPLVQVRGIPQLLGLHGLPPCSHPSEGVG